MSADFLPVINCPICDESVPVPVTARLIPYLVDGHAATVRLTADWSVHECFRAVAAEPTEVGLCPDHAPTITVVDGTRFLRVGHAGASYSLAPHPDDEADTPETKD